VEKSESVEYPTGARADVARVFDDVDARVATGADLRLSGARPVHGSCEPR